MDFLINMLETINAWMLAGSSVPLDHCQMLECCVAYLKVTDLETSNTSLKNELESMRNAVDQLTREKHELVKNLEAVEEQQRGHLQNERKQFESLLLDAQKAQVQRIFHCFCRCPSHWCLTLFPYLSDSSNEHCYPV